MGRAVFVEALSANFLGIILGLIGFILRKKRPNVARGFYLAAIIYDATTVFSQISFITRAIANKDLFSKSGLEAFISIHIYTIVTLIIFLIIFIYLRSKAGKYLEMEAKKRLGRKKKSK